MGERFKKFIGAEPVKIGITADGAAVVSDGARRVIPWLVAMAFFMQLLDGTILNTALPSIAANLNESPLRMQSVVIAYLLTVAILIPASGWLADRFGIRRVFIAAIALFSFGSLCCALSHSLAQLVAGRIIQGIGGAIMTPVGRLAILRITPRKDLIRVLSFISIPGLIGPLLGPALGGLLVQYASWHWIFIINIPVGGLGIYLTLRHMPPLILAGVYKFDWAGFLLLALMMLSFSLGMEGMGELHVPPAVYRSLLATAAVCLFVYMAHARRAEHPLFEPRLFKNITFSTGIAGNLLSRLGGGAMPFLMPLYLQVGMGFSPARAGLTMIPMSLGAIVSKLFVAKAVRRLGFRNMLIVNTVLLGLMMMSFSLMWQYDNYGLMLLHLTCFGIINSTQFSIMNTSTLMELSTEEASAGNSMLSLVMQLSQSMAVSVAAFALGFFIAHPEGAAAAHTPGGTNTLLAFSYTYIAMGCVTISSSLIFRKMPKGLGRETSKDAPPNAP